MSRLESFYKRNPYHLGQAFVVFLILVSPLIITYLIACRVWEERGELAGFYDGSWGYIKTGELQ